MKAVLMRVTKAAVSVDGKVVGEISRPGLLALVGVHREDSATDADTMARKIAELRILRDEQSVEQAAAPVLVVSQFTLLGRTAKGRRPSWSDAASGEQARELVDAVVKRLRERGIEVETGEFGAMMEVSSVNDGPFTIMVDTH